ncbi:single-stranded-DNA-specific exonuclease RecJ [uncultured Limosilactobacillus sp.]|uniref:single-stranded-DNA-specific exonuclease RecJ n=1 Tax=uncultured Limosilactobacillus sp. TaxID=2837629 RepID=UPI0025D1FF74|nr:single-stranded-DNA-specific exonuclease RecJ [uncultured Limosilactobacillus sp.]
MLKTKFKWQLTAPQDSELVRQIQEQCQISKVIANLLVADGFTSVHDVQLFLKPQLQQIQSPEKLHDMDKAVTRITKAIEKGEQVTVYGDYDADGMTATSLMLETLETLGANVNYYIPDRFQDGYGPNQEAYQRLIKNGTQLILTVDNGVTGQKEVAYAKKQGVDVIITDHHSLPAELPSAVAIVHPQYPGDYYEYGDLSGVGVAFKLSWALLGEFPTEMLDLVAIGEIADLVSMAKENHALVKFGIQQLQAGLRPGIQALLKLAGVSAASLTSKDVSFKLAPRLNALGRISDGNDGVKLLTTVDENTAEKLAKKVDECNRERQQLVDQITKEALQKAQAPDNIQRQTLLIVGHDWHQGVLGIVASRLVEKTGKPTIIASVNHGELVAKGSGRSVGGYDLFAALNPHRKLMTAFGGHTMACGMSFLITQTPAIAKVLEQAAQKQHLDITHKPVLKIAGQLTANDISEKLYRQIQLLAPFGPDNEEPVFEIDQPTIISDQQIGKNQEHLKFTLASRHQVEVLAFGQGNHHDYFTPGSAIDLAGTISVNTWRGKTTPQLMLMDQKVVGPVVMDFRAKKLEPKMFTERADYVTFNSKIRKNITGHATGTVINGEQPEKMNHETLIFVDLPKSLAQISKVLQMTQKANVIKLYLFNTGTKLEDEIPPRQTFVNFYQIIRQSQQININQQAGKLSHYLKVNGNQLILMIKVFLELRFVTMKNGLLKISVHPQKGKLEQTQAYQNYFTQRQVQKALLKSTTQELTEWVRRKLHSN